MTVSRERYFQIGKLGPWKIGNEQIPSGSGFSDYKTDMPMYSGSKERSSALVSVPSDDRVTIVAHCYIADLEGPQITAFNDFTLKGKWPGITYRLRYDGDSTAHVPTEAERAIIRREEMRQRLAEAMMPDII